MRSRICVPTFLLAAWLGYAAPDTPRVTAPFDADWRFLKADAPGAEAPGFDDSKWRPLSLPHDWSIEGPFDQNNPTGGAGGFLPAGVGWYRKHFTLAASDSHRRVYLEFDGVMANSDVWINGFHLGKRPYGYVSFRYDLTGHLQFGPDKPNVVAVRADNSGQPASRWYSGAGIYRHVRLLVMDPVHLEQWATFVSTPKITAQQATLHVETAVVNQSDAASAVAVAAVVQGPDGKLAATQVFPLQTIAAGATAPFAGDVPIPSPALWNLDRPALYRATITVVRGKVNIDDEAVVFGVREFHFDPATGFWLNGRNFKIKGVCLHADGGAVGAAVPLSIWERRLETLRALGVNAIRTAHDPVVPEFLDLCDRKGFLVMDEMFDCWTVGKNRFDYHLYFNVWSKIDTRDTVRRDRNHPSIILYSAGNEIHDTPHADLAKGILGGLVEVFHREDPTRPVTQALFRPNVSHDYDDGLADMLDVVGQNYRENEILAAHTQKPERKIIGTENQHGVEVWRALRDNPPYAGQFLWSGIDYLGEAPRWPLISNPSGLLDRVGDIKPMGYQRQSWWSDKPMVRIVRRVAPQARGPVDPGYEPNAPRFQRTLYADWTPANTAPHEEHVEVYSNCADVELFLNGESLGSKPLPHDATPRVWRVPFEAGTLRAVARIAGEEAAADELKTAGEPARIVLTTDRVRLTSAWDDVAFVRATVADANGVTVPGSQAKIAFAVSGPAAIAAVDNGDIASIEPFHAAERTVFDGRAIAIVRATSSSGKIAVTAWSAGLTGGSVQIEAAGGK